MYNVHQNLFLDSNNKDKTEGKNFSHTMYI